VVSDLRAAAERAAKWFKEYCRTPDWMAEGSAPVSPDEDATELRDALRAALAEPPQPEPDPVRRFLAHPSFRAIEGPCSYRTDWEAWYAGADAEERSVIGPTAEAAAEAALKAIESAEAPHHTDAQLDALVRKIKEA
jgi:hypothetical protein